MLLPFGKGNCQNLFLQRRDINKVNFNSDLFEDFIRFVADALPISLWQQVKFSLTDNRLIAERYKLGHKERKGSPLSLSGLSFWCRRLVVTSDGG